MSNLSLKEQLEALALAAPNKANSQTPQDKKMKKPGEKGKKAKPAWLEHAQYGVELLKAYYPQCFKEAKDIKPLKVGIKQDLVKNLGGRDDVVINDKACMVNSLAYYVNSVAYHKAMVEGAMRIDLDGVAAGVVTAEESKYSADCRKAKLMKKQNTTAAKVESVEQ